MAKQIIADPAELKIDFNDWSTLELMVYLGHHVDLKEAEHCAKKVNKLFSENHYKALILN